MSDSDLLLAFMASSRALPPPRSTRRATPWALCQQQPALGCLAYLDSDNASDAPGVRAVPLREYMRGRGAAPDDCCARASLSEQARRFWCDGHRRLTLAAQYRFLPALAHARSTRAWRRGGQRWLVLADEDSEVSLPSLRGALRGVEAAAPPQPKLYLGDAIVETAGGVAM